MTIDERVRLAMSGLRLRTDETGRPPSHDEVEQVMRKVLSECALPELDGVGEVGPQLIRLASDLTYALRLRLGSLKGLKAMMIEFSFEGQLYAYSFKGPGYSQAVRDALRAEAEAEFPNDGRNG